MNRSRAFSVVVRGLIGLCVCLLAVGCDRPLPGKSKLIEQGDAQLWRGHYTEAIGLYKGALEHGPSDPDVLYRIGMCYSYQGEDREAIYWFERALRSYPGHGPAQAAVEQARGRQADAARRTPSLPAPVLPPGQVAPPPAVFPPPAPPWQTSDARPTDPRPSPGAPIEPPQLTPRRQAERFLDVARRWEAEGEWDQALHNYQRAVEAAPDQAFTHAALGRFYYTRLGQNDKAIEHLHKARGLNPTEPGVAEDLAKLGAD